MRKNEDTSPASETLRPEWLKYLTSEQVAQVKEFWTMQAELGVRQRLNVIGILIMACAPLAGAMITSELGDNAALIKKISFTATIVGTFVGGMSVILNRLNSAQLERIVQSMDIRVGLMEKVIGVGRAVKQIKFVPFGERIFQRFRQDRGGE